MKKNHRIAALLVLAAAAVAPLAQAQTGSAYAGVSVGDTDLGTAAKLYAGSRLGANWGWEAQYTDFGSRTENIFGASVKARAFALGGSLVGYLPLQQNFSGFGKIGAHYVKAKASTGGFSASDSSTELGVGVGVLWQATPQVGLRAEWENIGGDGGDVFSVGVQFKF